MKAGVNRTKIRRKNTRKVIMVAGQNLLLPGCDRSSFLEKVVLETELWEFKKIRGRIGFWRGNRRERHHWGDLGVDGWIILGWISRCWDVGIWTGLGWPRIGTGGGRL